MKIINKPKISVILTTYNGQRFIKEAIASILKQTLSDFQFIIVNDGSVDETEKIILSIKDDRIEYYLIDHVGHANALNYGLSKCKAELTSIIDHDDIASPEKFQMQFDLFNKNDNVGVIGSVYSFIDENGKLLNRINVPLVNNEIKEKLLYRDVICHSGVMYKTKLIKDVGGYYQKYDVASDYELWLRIVNKTDFLNIRECLMRTRKHKLSQTSPIKSFKNNNKCALLALNDHSYLVPIEKMYVKAIWEILYGDVKVGRKRLIREICESITPIGTKFKYLILSLLNRETINCYFYFNPLRRINIFVKRTNQ